jgi:hypothetical protein
MKTIYLAAFLTLFAPQAFACQIESPSSILDVDKNAGFAGVQLGDPINKEFSALPENIQVLERRSYSSEEVKWYSYTRSPKAIDGAELRYVYYGFKQDRLVEIAMAFKILDKPEKRIQFLQMLEKHFGGKRVNSEMWLWTGKKVGLDFSGYCGLDTCSLSFLYIFPTDRIGKFSATEKAADRAEDAITKQSK